MKFLDPLIRGHGFHGFHAAYGSHGFHWGPKWGHQALGLDILEMLANHLKKFGRRSAGPFLIIIDFTQRLLHMFLSMFCITLISFSARIRDPMKFLDSLNGGHGFHGIHGAYGTRGLSRTA